jgi:uncharacterized protein (TIGR02453 family)
MLQATTVKFLSNIAKNNNKAWMDANRNQYLAAKEDFENFVAQLIDKTGAIDADIKGLEAKNCVFRMNRDIRFSKDKSPYKTNMGASFAKGGKKSIYAGYYFHCQPGNSFVGGGLWMPMPGDLQKIRQEIDYNFPDFSKIIRGKKFSAQYAGLNMDSEYTLSRPPKGYDDGNPAIAYIKLKSFVTMKPLGDAALTSKTLVKDTVAAFAALQPLVQFINHALD